MSRRRSRGSCERRTLKLAIVGGFVGTHVAGSLATAASGLGFETMNFDTTDAAFGLRLIDALFWRLADRRPPLLDRFSSMVVDKCHEARPDVLIATGSAALTAPALRALRGLGVVCMNFSADDPWNGAMGSRWHRRALPNYDLVFTPRRSNLNDFAALGCRDVRYLPFGYDDALFAPPPAPANGPAIEVLFVGGADRERAAFMGAFMRAGPPVALVGGYWDRFPETRRCNLGHKAPEEVCALTAAAKVNLCLVRRANRDGHVMRTFEIAAIGGCMLVEDTVEHREIFGREGDCVNYFRDPDEAAARARGLLANPDQRARLARSVRERISAGHHTYRDRLTSMLDAALEKRESYERSARRSPAP